MTEIRVHSHYLIRVFAGRSMDIKCFNASTAGQGKLIRLQICSWRHSICFKKKIRFTWNVQTYCLWNRRKIRFLTSRLKCSATNWYHPTSILSTPISSTPISSIPISSTIPFRLLPFGPLSHFFSFHFVHFDSNKMGKWEWNWNIT